MSNLIGQSLGRYHVLEKLGEGGMATVYKAYDTRLERDVAVKIIRKEAFSQEVIERILKRFEREAKTLAKLTHPNIVPIIDYGEHENSPYLVMPYLAGGTLKGQMGKPRAWQDAIRLLLPVAKALAYAHGEDVIHRDVKPANILITPSGEPMLTDFGIAKMLDLEGGQTITGTGVGVGTPEYMAPEQGMGKEIDGRADVYALGIILYELITGRKPFTADTPMAVVFKHMTDPLPRPGEIIPGLPEAVEKTIFKALAKDPADRYQDMSGFAAALSKIDHQGDGRTQEAEVSRDRMALEPFEEGNLDTVDNLEPSLESLKKKVPPASMQQPPTQPYPPAPGLKSGQVNAGGIVAICLAGVGLLVLIIGTASGWFRPRIAPYAPTEAPVQTEAPAAEDLEPAAGTIQISAVDGMPMVYVPAGEFSMGSNDGKDNEKPVHTVYLDGYWIDQTEVTNAMYAICVATGECTRPSRTSSYKRDSYYGNSQYDDYPVIYVDWQQAQDYCRWTGRKLPTEAQWEKATRGTDERTYPWGDKSPTDTLVNYNYSIGDTMEVGYFSYGASPYGALDMAGNVHEWVADWYAPDYYQNSPINNPESPTSGDYRVLRGGFWGSDTGLIRSASRSWLSPSLTSYSVGFRCSSSLP